MPSTSGGPETQARQRLRLAFAVQPRTTADMDDPLILGLLGLSFLLAGLIKGAVGMGLPTTAVGLMTLSLDPRTAIALILIPMMASNAWQVHRMGDVAGAVRRYLPFAAALILGVWITVTLARTAPDRVLLGTLGAALLVFVAVNASKWVPRVPEHRDRTRG